MKSDMRADKLDPAECQRKRPKSSDLRRKRDVGETRYEISMWVLNPKEVRRTWPISMARLDLRLIILGGGDPGHQSERVLQLSLVFFISFII